jgi:DNA-binding NarL/FixJ family response regulator
MLVVDDHDGMRASLASWLAHVVPHRRLIEAASGEAALQLVTASHVDLVLMDISLPGISGIEAARRIKAASPATHVVMLTMHDGADYRAASAAAGASGFVFKGMMHQQLPPLIHALLGAADAAAGCA